MVKINCKKSFRSSKVSAAESADQDCSQKLNHSEYRRESFPREYRFNYVNEVSSNKIT